MNRRQALITAAALVVAGRARAQSWGDPPTPAAESVDAPQWPGAETLELWPDGLPGGETAAPAWDATMNGPMGERQLWVRGVARPSLSVYRPERPNGVAVMIVPGGGYEFISVQAEGLAVAQRLNAEGITAFVLSYRLPAEGWTARADVSLQDAQRGLRLIRSGAFGAEAASVAAGVLGFSAGGHLAAMLSTAWDEPVYAPVDGADAVSARPDFAALIYPVILTEGPDAHAGSRDHLLGLSPSPALLAARSPLGRISATTPPSFLAHSTDDGLVPPANSLRYAAALAAVNVPAELHLFDHGGHGYGMRGGPDSAGGQWPGLLAAWIRRRVAAP